VIELGLEVEQAGDLPGRARVARHQAQQEPLGPRDPVALAHAVVDRPQQAQ
jgi:hypothetical protein